MPSFSTNANGTSLLNNREINTSSSKLTTNHDSVLQDMQQDVQQNFMQQSILHKINQPDQENKKWIQTASLSNFKYSMSENEYTSPILGTLKPSNSSQSQIMQKINLEHLMTTPIYNNSSQSSGIQNSDTPIKNIDRIAVDSIQNSTIVNNPSTKEKTLSIYTRGRKRANTFNHTSPLQKSHRNHGQQNNLSNKNSLEDGSIFERPSQRIQEVLDGSRSWKQSKSEGHDKIFTDVTPKHGSLSDVHKEKNNKLLHPENNFVGIGSNLNSPIPDRPTTPSSYQKLISTIRVRSPEGDAKSIESPSQQRLQIFSPDKFSQFSLANRNSARTPPDNFAESLHIKPPLLKDLQQDSLGSLLLELQPSPPTPLPPELIPQTLNVSLENLIHLISAIGLEPFQSMWEEEDELDCSDFVAEASKVLKTFVVNNATLIKEKHPDFIWIIDLNNMSYSLPPNGDTCPNNLWYVEKMKSQLESLFNRIDANGNGMLDWDEFASFFLLGLEGDRKMKLSELEDKCYQLEEDNRPTDHDKKHFHKDKIQRIIIDDENSIYYTLSEHGQLKRWLFMKSTQTYIFLANMNHSSNRILDVQIYDRYVIHSDLSRRFFFFDRVSGELVCTLVGRNGSRRKNRNVFENNNFLSNVNKQLTSQSSKSQDGIAMLERIQQLSEKDQASDIVQYKIAEKRKNYLGGYKQKLLGKDHKQKQTQENHRVYILESLGQHGGIPMSFKITKYKDNEFAVDVPSKDLLIIGTDGGLLKSYDITRVFQENNSIISKSKNECSIFPLKTSEKCHTGWISCLEVDPKEKVIITGSWDCTIKVWSMQFLTLLRTLQGHKKPVYSLIYDPKVKLIASCGREKDIYLWKPHSPSAIDIFSGHDSPVLGVTFNLQENQLVSLSSDQVIRVWDLFLYKCVQIIPVHLEYASMNLTCISVDQSRNCVVAGNFSNGISKFTSWYMKKNMHTIGQDYQGHKTSIVKVLWNKRSKEVVTCDQHSIAVWNCLTGKMIFKFHSEDEIVDMCFDSLKRRIVVSYTFSKVLRIFNFYNGQCLKTLTNEISQKEVASIIYINQKLKRERSIIGGTEEGNILKWIDSDDSVESIRERFEKNSLSVTCVEFSAPDNLIIGYEDGGIWLVSLSQGCTRMKTTYKSQTNRLNKKEGAKSHRLRAISRKDLIERSRSPIKYASQFKSPTHRRTEQKRSSSANSIRQDSILERHKQDNLQVEVLHCLKKKKPLFICAYGNGVLSFSSTQNLNEIFRIKATETSQDTVTCIVSSNDNNILAIGDSSGFITIFDISSIQDPQSAKGSSFTISNSDLVVKKKFQAFEGNGVSTLAFADDINCIIAGGGEKYVAMYSLHGRLVGVYGQSKQWDIEDESTWGLESIPGVREDTSNQVLNSTEPDDSMKFDPSINTNSLITRWLNTIEKNTTPQSPDSTLIRSEFQLHQKHKRSMDEFEDLEMIIQERVHQKEKSLNKDSSSHLPTLNPRAQKKLPDSQLLEIQHHREKSRIAFENHFRKGHHYEQRIHSYLEIEKMFLNPNILGNWKHDNTFHK